MSLSKNGISICPCCNQKSLQPNGAFLTCATCGLAITTQALIQAVRHMQEPTALDTGVITSTH